MVTSLPLGRCRGAQWEPDRFSTSGALVDRSICGCRTRQQSPGMPSWKAWRAAAVPRKPGRTVVAPYLRGRGLQDCLRTLRGPGDSQEARETDPVLVLTSDDVRRKWVLSVEDWGEIRGCIG
jgi:hypothetical protein